MSTFTSILLVSLGLSRCFDAKNIPFLFPHGYFDLNKLQPFDAMYLNMMAQSNLEYGGTTLEELKIPRPIEVTESPFTTKKPKDTDSLPLQQFDTDKDRLANENDFPKPPPPPFVDAKRSALKRLKDEPESEGDGENPFEEIVTRAPPLGFGKFRGQSRNEMNRQPSYHPKFLSRSSIVHGSTKTPPTTTTMVPIQDSEGGFEEIFKLPHARRLVERQFDHEKRLERQWRQTKEAKLSYRQHSGQNLTTAEEQETAASYRKIKDNFETDRPSESYRRHLDKLRVNATDSESEEVDVLDAILEQEILESARNNHKRKGDDSKNKKPTMSPTLSPIENTTPISTILENDPLSTLDLSKPQVLKLPIPPSLWANDWMTEFNT